jgi:[CysO sulfur-carrier protein]-S-L-cysteine hydrolase
MLEHVVRMAPEEACGIVAGQHRRSMAVFPVENILHSPTRFRMHPERQVKVYFEILEKGWDLAAIYHSHPAGPPGPSPTDVAASAYPDAVNLIWSPQVGVWNCRGYLIRQEQIEVVQLCTFSGV